MSHIHIPDGVLPLWLWGLGWVVALALVIVAGKLAERHEMRRKVPLLGVVSALMLVAMSSEIVPIAYHVNLTVVAGIILGPVLSIVAAFIVQVVLAMLGHGGVTVVGLNTLLTAGEMILGWALFRGIVGLMGRPRSRTAAGVATVITLAMTTTALVGIVWLGGTSAASRETGALDPGTLRFENPFQSGVFSVGLFSGGEHDEGEHGEEEHGEEASEEHSESPESEGESALSVERFALVVYTLGPIGWALEALVSAVVVGYVARVRPTLIFGGALAERERGRLPGDEAGGM